MGRVLEDQRQRATEQNRRAEEDRRDAAEATKEAEGQALIPACDLCNERGLIRDDTTTTGLRECDHPDTSSGDAGASTSAPMSEAVDIVAAAFCVTDFTGTPEAQPKDVDMIVGEITMNEGAHK